MKFSRFLSFLLLFLLWLILYSCRISALRKPNFPEDILVKVEGKIADETYLKGSNQIISLKDLTIYSNQFPRFHYNNRIKIIGKIQKKVITKNYDQFLMYYPQISLISTGENEFSFPGLILKTRIYFQKIFDRLYPQPHASLLSGILMGTSGNQDQEFTTALRNSGTMHIIAASGYNVTQVAVAVIAFFLLFFSRRKTLIIAIFSIFAYALLAGAGPAVTRAALMASLGYLAQLLGREKNIVSVIISTAAIMLIFDPLIYINIGFQLSFAATAGLFLISPLIQKISLVKKIWAGQELASTLAAQISTLPIILFHFGSFSLLSPLANLLILPFIPILMFLGSLSLMTALIFFPLARLVALPTWALLTYFIKVISFFGSQKLFLVSYHISFIVILIYYLSLLGFFLILEALRPDGRGIPTYASSELKSAEAENISVSHDLGRGIPRRRIERNVQK